jgi:hypothetical protein
MEMSGQLHAPAALTPRKKHVVPIGQEAGWSPEPGLDAMVKKKIPSPRRESNPDHPIVQPVVSRYTNWVFKAKEEGGFQFKVTRVKRKGKVIHTPAALPPGKEPLVPIG